MTFQPALLLCKAEPWVCRDLSITCGITLASLGPCLGPSEQAWPYYPSVCWVVCLASPNVVASSGSASWPLPWCGALLCLPMSPDGFHPPRTQGRNLGAKKPNVHKAPVSASTSWQLLPALSAFKRDYLQFLSSFFYICFLNVQALTLWFWAA